MKKIITILIIAVISSAVVAGEQKLNKQIAVLESKVFALETENKKLKKELEKKNKAITSLAMRLAGQPAKTTGRTRTARSRYSSSSRYNPAQAAKAAAEKQKKERARQLAIIKKKIIYFKAQKKDLQKKYNAEEKKLKDARYLIRREEREKTIKLVQKKQKRIKNEIEQFESGIKSLEAQAFNYQ